MSTQKAQAPKESLVTIVNKRRRMKTFNLGGEHMRAHASLGYQRIAQQETVLDPRTGIHRQKRGRASVPQSITFLAREKKVNVPAAILQCPEVRDAWKKFGHLKVIFQDGTEDVKTPEPTARKTLLQLQKEKEAELAKQESEHAASLKPAKPMSKPAKQPTTPKGSE